MKREENDIDHDIGDSSGEVGKKSFTLIKDNFCLLLKDFLGVPLHQDREPPGSEGENKTERQRD